MHKQSPRSIYTKLSTAPLKTHSAKLTLPKTWSRIRHIYGNPSGGYGTCEGISPKWITDQITDHFAPYCYELSTAAINKIRVLAACWRSAGASTSHLLRHHILIITVTTMSGAIPAHDQGFRTVLCDWCSISPLISAIIPAKPQLVISRG